MLLLSRVVFWVGLAWLMCSAFLTYPLVHTAVIQATSDLIGTEFTPEIAGKITGKILDSIPNFFVPSILLFLGQIISWTVTRDAKKSAEQGAAANP